MSEWISVEERLPEPMKVVLVRQRTGCQDKSVTVIGQWIPALTEEADADAVDWLDYDEATDASYVPEGWYEMQVNWGEYSSIYIHEAVTHWMPLPEPPK